jgi:hypothetical protein
VKEAFALPVSTSVTVTSAIERAGSASLSVIVPSPFASRRVAFEALERLTVKVSSISSSRSPATAIVTVFVVSPASKVSVVAASAA